jgi:hypothetical protein
MNIHGKISLWNGYQAIKVWGPLLSLVCFLSGCEKTREAFGLTRQQPDEFTAPPRFSLERPTHLELMPPQPGTAPRARIAPDIKAREVLNISTNMTEMKGLSASEIALLQSANVKAANPHIRQIIHQETVDRTPSKTIINKVLFWQKPQMPGEVIDPHAERRKYPPYPQETDHED